MNETQFKVRVQQFLNEIGVWHVKFMGTAYTPVGIPDILCCIKGFFFGIELKTDHGVVSAMQIRQLELINQSGGVGIILRPKDFDLFRKEVTMWINLVTVESSNGKSVGTAGFFTTFRKPKPSLIKNRTTP